MAGVMTLKRYGASTFGKMGARKMMWDKPYLKRVEYLEATGTQHIDVPYIPSDTSGIKAVWAYTADRDAVIAGSRASSGGNTRWFIGHYPGGLYFGWNVLIATTPTSLDTFYECRLNFYNNRKATLNNSDVASISESLNTDEMAPMGLFNIVNATNKARAKLKSCQITNGSNLAFDLIPVIDLNGEPKMFDQVTLTYPAHYGSFIAGPDLA